MRSNEKHGREKLAGDLLWLDVDIRSVLPTRSIVVFIKEFGEFR